MEAKPGNPNWERSYRCCRPRGDQRFRNIAAGVLVSLSGLQVPPILLRTFCCVLSD